MAINDHTLSAGEIVAAFTKENAAVKPTGGGAGTPWAPATSLNLPLPIVKSYRLDVRGHPVGCLTATSV
jgi:hypothetical protein